MYSTDNGFAPFVVIGLGLIMVCINILRPKKNTPPSKPLTPKEIAKQLGLTLFTERSSAVERKFEFINRMQYGKTKYLSNIMHGTYHRHKIWAFHVRYDTKSIAPGNAPDDYYSFFIIQLPKSFPEMTIYPEGLVSKLYQTVRHNDIDFESHEFSRKFRVRSEHPRLAYSFCNPEMESFLLKHTNLGIELDRNYLCISQNRLVPISQFRQYLDWLVEIRSLMPDYLFTE